MGFRTLIPMDGGAPTKPILTYGAFGLTGGNGVLVTSSGTIGTQGPVQPLGTLNQAIDRLRLRIYSQNSRSLRLNIFANGVLIIANQLVQVGGFSITSLPLPIRIAAGVALTVSHAADGASTGVQITAMGVTSSVSETITAWKQLTPVGGNTASPVLDGVTLDETTNAWVSVGILAEDAKAIVAAITNNNDNARTAGRGYVELAAGADPAIPSWSTTILRASGGAQTAPLDHEPIEQAFAGGTPFWARAFSTTAADAINLQLAYGA